jgi:hypothetical protein
MLVLEVKNNFRMNNKRVTPAKSWIFSLFLRFIVFMFIFGAKLSDFQVLVKGGLPAGGWIK